MNLKVLENSEKVYGAESNWGTRDEKQVGATVSPVPNGLVECHDCFKSNYSIFFCVFCDAGISSWPNFLRR